MPDWQGSTLETESPRGMGIWLEGVISFQPGYNFSRKGIIEEWAKPARR